jgi:hypothetical protein
MMRTPRHRELGARRHSCQHAALSDLPSQQSAGQRRCVSLPEPWAGDGRHCGFVTVLAEVAAERSGLRLAIFKVRYVAGDGAEHQVPLAISSSTGL